METRPLRLPRLLHDDQLADLSLHEDEEVEEDGWDDCGEHGPHWQGGFRASGWRDQPTPGTAVGHLMTDVDKSPFLTKLVFKYSLLSPGFHPGYSASL